MKLQNALTAATLTMVLTAIVFAQNTSTAMTPESINPNSAEGQLVLDKINATTTSRTDGGAIILEDDLLNPAKKHVVFVVAKHIGGDVYLAFQTLASDGQAHQHQMLHFTQGLEQGQTFELWNGEFNKFQSTPWLRFDVTIVNVDQVFYTMMQTPIMQAEQYKEPLIDSVSEARVSGDVYTFTLRGNFDAYEPSTVVLNTNIFVPMKSVIHPGPGILQFTTNLPRWQLSGGKYLITVCEAGHCDTMVARHR